MAGSTPGRPQPAVTELLRRWQNGEEGAESALFQTIYPALKAIAAGRISEDPANPSLQPTELVHEAYLRLVRQGGAGWQNRQQFFAIAARVMRRVLVDHFRRKASLKRGAGQRALPLLDGAEAATASPSEWLEFEQALSDLERADERSGRVVELRYFAGLSVEETAEVLGVSRRTVLREWRFARAFLARHLRIDRPDRRD